MKLREAVQLWLAEVSPALRAATRRNYAGHIEAWLHGFGNRVLQAVNFRSVEASMRERAKAVSPGTVNQERSTLGIFWTWAERAGLVVGNPVKLTRPLRHKPRAPRSLTDEEEARLLCHCDEKLGSIVRFAIETGLREGALLHLRRENIDLATRTMRVPAALMKSREELTVPLSDAALLVAISRPNSLLWQWEPSTLRYHFARACAKAGIIGARFHDLRRTFFTRCRQRGVPVETAMALTDHRSVETALKCYRTVELSEMRAALPQPKEANG